MESEDSAQKVMINAFRHLRNFPGNAKFSTRLVTIAMNEGLQRLCKAKAAPRETLDEGKKARKKPLTPVVRADWLPILPGQ